jgi:hypothetical protein
VINNHFKFIVTLSIIGLMLYFNVIPWEKVIGWIDKLIANI